MPDITFKITSRNGKKAFGTISWPSKNLSAPAISGTVYSDEAINVGSWIGLRSKLLDKASGTPYCDVASGTVGARGHCWMQAFENQFGRTEMGLHPDGGTSGATNGCIGITSADTSEWYNALYAVQANGSIIVEVIEFI